ncbi:MAG TPA: acyl-CoA dehydrogenase family protein [Cytophagaceae bacterium]|jgi:alkylation response protein AidB-like acyl-CoA dehydrogenase|nr:acyl-CoA dehydrogenase family protein [Cytophagaceae bacterium]
MDIDFLFPQSESKRLVEKAKFLSESLFTHRASDYDASGMFPKQDFHDLFDNGLMAALIGKDHGGLGLGPARGDVFTLWMITKYIAKANLSLARCWEAHNNALLLIDSIASEEQKKIWCKGIVERGEIWTVWSGEPQAKTPEQQKKIGTHLTEVQGGFLLNGSKVFASSASGAQWAILLVNTATSGGARHATYAAESLIMVVCNLNDSSLTFDGSWWNPIGMKSSDSLRVEFNDTFIPKENILGIAGEYLNGAWQTRFTPHYTASFLGAAEAAYDYALQYVDTQKKSNDPYIQNRIGEMSVNLETGHLWLRHVASLWETNKIQAAQKAGIQNRFLMENLATNILLDCTKVCGARSLIKPSSVERIFRDLAMYVRNDNNDHVLATLGRLILGKNADVSFHHI